MSRYDVLLLKARNLIANKEWATACANMDTARAGAWTCDWFQQVRDDEAELTATLDELMGLCKSKDD